MYLKDIIRRVRNRLDDKRGPRYLWDDQELIDYTNDTIRDAAIRANLTVQDDIPIVFTQNPDLTYVSKYALPSGYLDIKSVRLLSLPNITLARTSMRRQESYYGGRPTQNGKPWGYAVDLTMPGLGEDTGIQVRAITFIGTPLEADTAMVDVIRLPGLIEYDYDVPEIDEIWHPDLLFGITALAYLKRDSDTFDQKKSDRDFERFEERFGERLSAVTIRERQAEAPFEMIVS